MLNVEKIVISRRNMPSAKPPRSTLLSAKKHSLQNERILKNKLNIPTEVERWVFGYHTDSAFDRNYDSDEFEKIDDSYLAKFDESSKDEDDENKPKIDPAMVQVQKDKIRDIIRNLRRSKELKKKLMKNPFLADTIDKQKSEEKPAEVVIKNDEAQLDEEIKKFLEERAKEGLKLAEEEQNIIKKKPVKDSGFKFKSINNGMTRAVPGSLQQNITLERTFFKDLMKLSKQRYLSKLSIDFQKRRFVEKQENKGFVVDTKVNGTLVDQKIESARSKLTTAESADRSRYKSAKSLSSFSIRRSSSTKEQRPISELVNKHKLRELNRKLEFVKTSRPSTTSLARIKFRPSDYEDDDDESDSQPVVTIKKKPPTPPPVIKTPVEAEIITTATTTTTKTTTATTASSTTTTKPIISNLSKNFVSKRPSTSLATANNTIETDKIIKKKLSITPTILTNTFMPTSLNTNNKNSRPVSVRIIPDDFSSSRSTSERGTSLSTHTRASPPMSAAPRCDPINDHRYRMLVGSMNTVYTQDGSVNKNIEISKQISEPSERVRNLIKSNKALQGPGWNGNFEKEKPTGLEIEMNRKLFERLVSDLF